MSHGAGRMLMLVCWRWWSHTVQSLQVPAPLTVAPSLSCQKAVQILRAKTFDQAPVVDETGYSLHDFLLYCLTESSSCRALRLHVSFSVSCDRRAILGMVTLGTILSSVHDGKVELSDAVGAVLCKDFQQVKRRSNLTLKLRSHNPWPGAFTPDCCYLILAHACHAV